MNISDTTMRYIVASTIAVLLLGLGYASFSGKKQDEQFLTEQTTFTQAIQYVQEEQYDQALPLLQQVDNKHANSDVVKYYLGATLANLGDWSKASIEYQKILDLNPYKVEDSIFMIQYGNALLNAKKIDEAKVVLERCLTLQVPEQMPDYQEQVNALLMQISASS